MKSDSKALERAVRSVLYAGAISAVAVTPLAMAQEEGDGEDAAELGQQVVTGSRIKRIDLEEARPVVVITREEIELSGQESVADVLRNSPINTFGSSREVSGNSWLGQATISLHGLGSTRSLVLLDGRRSPRSPVTANQANDLNIIPLAAVDRIEILTDSASAIYGSDAIGGVINIILRKDYDGMEFGASGRAAHARRRGLRGRRADHRRRDQSGPLPVLGRFPQQVAYRLAGPRLHQGQPRLRCRHGRLSQCALSGLLVRLGQHRQRQFLGQHHLAFLSGPAELRAGCGPCHRRAPAGRPLHRGQRLGEMRL